MNLADGYTLMLQAIAQAMTPDPELHLDQWSEQHVVIPKGSAFAGPYRLAHTPMARRILQCLSPSHHATRVVVRGASQMLKTQVAVNAILGWIDGAPANILTLEPTDKLAKRLSARVAKAIDACSPVRAKVAKPRSRDARNTIDTKEFDGGAVHIVTAGAAANLAEIPARYVIGDEIDRMDVSVNEEGDPIALAEARTTTYEGISKTYLVSSPTIVGASKIDAEFARGTQETYHVPCPRCGHLHALEQDNFHYDYDEASDRVASAWFACPDCGGLIEEHHKPTMLADQAMGGQARWVAASDGDGETVSFHINAFYAPLGSISWRRLARQHAHAERRAQRGDTSARQVYYNTRLALSYDNATSTTTVDKLMARREPLPARVIPDAALVLTMAVDTQPDRLECHIRAWGPGMESWPIDTIILVGDPSEHPSTPGSVWARLDEIRRTPFQHASGASPIPISAYGIDSGGANTQDVYNYGMSRRRLGCRILKGASRPNRPIISSKPSNVDVRWNGQRTEGGAELWLVGTDVAKDWLHNRLTLDAGPGAIHFADWQPREWFEQLLAERKLIKYIKGFPKVEWFKQPGDRNEALDVMVYNVAIAHHLGLHKWSAQDWADLRARLAPAHLTPDLFAQSPAQPVAPAVAPSESASNQPPAPAHQAPAAIKTEQPPQPPAQPVAPVVAPRAPIPARRTFSRGVTL